MFLDNHPVIHLIDEATHFTASDFLRNQNSAYIWTKICNLWSHTYLGPPDFLMVDQGTNYTSNEFIQETSEACVQLLEAPIESSNTISHIERYHTQLRAALERIRPELASETSYHYCLRFTVYENNCTMGPEVLCAILLLFGAFPRQIINTLEKMQIELGSYIYLEMK